MSTLSQNLLSLRKARKLTQAELAKLAHVSSDYVSKIEKGQCLNVGIKHLANLATVLETNPWDLCGDTINSSVSN